MARPRNDSSGGWWTEADDLKTYLGLLQGGRLDVFDLGTQYYSPTEATEVYNRLITDKKFPTVQFDWRDME
jgi:hypothetical protein